MNFNNLCLETKRLILRSITLSDAQDIFEYAQNPNLTNFTDWEASETIEETKDFI